MGKRLIRAAAAALMLLGVGVPAWAAGLGRLTVLSDLGQPFRAEIELVSVKKDEASSLRARLANAEAFRQADLPFTAYVSALRVSVENRANGEAFVKILGTQPLNEPFIDFLVELTSTGGRIVRAYTALVDPPPIGEAEKAESAQVKPQAPSSEIKADAVPAAPAAPAPEPAAEMPPPKPQAPVAAPKKPKAKASGAAVDAPVAGDGAAAAASEYGPIKRGDTLGKIAREVKPAEVTLEQMLVLLYRANPDAFIGKNMNLLKTGKVLRVPDPAEAAELSAQAAAKEVKVQAANWRAYRERLAASAEAGPAMETEKGRSAAGKTTTAIEEKPGPATEPPKEVLKLSKGTPQGAADPAAGAKMRALEEEVAAKNKAVSESSQRIAQLEKQLKDLQALGELKNKGMAEAPKAGPVPLPKLPEPAPPPLPKPMDAGPKTLPPAADKPLAVGPKPLEPPKPAVPAEEKPLAVGPKPLDAGPKPLDAGPKPLDAGPKPLEPAPPPQGMTPTEPPKMEPPVAEKLPEPPKPKPKYVPPPPPPPPSLVDEVLGNPLLLAGGGAAVVALAGLGYMMAKRRRGDTPAGAGRNLSMQLGRKPESRPPTGDDTFEDTLPVGMAAGAAAAAAAPEAQPAGADESDALAEAEVFLIYGRDGQAEQRLKEAIEVTPTRFELHAKLLEIYAKRQDPQSFEAVAKELQMGTGGHGELWEKAVRLGYEIDPQNPRYAAGRPQDATFENTVPGTMIGGESTVRMQAFDGKPKDDLDFNLDFDAVGSPSSTDIDLENLGAELQTSPGSTTTDIDLGLLGGATDASDVLDPTRTIASTADELQRSSQVLAFDPTATLAPPDTGDLPTLPGVSAASAKKSADSGGLDFDLGGPALAADSDQTVAVPAAGKAGPDDVALSFDLDTLKLDAPALEPGSPGTGAGIPDLDLSTISLNLGDTETTVAPGSRDEKWYDVQTKFDLAKAYQEMGDKDGAREILQEVIAEGDPEQRASAEKLMASLG